MVPFIKKSEQVIKVNDTKTNVLEQISAEDMAAASTLLQSIKEDESVNVFRSVIRTHLTAATKLLCYLNDTAPHVASWLVRVIQNNERADALRVLERVYLASPLVAMALVERAQTEENEFLPGLLRLASIRAQVFAVHTLHAVSTRIAMETILTMLDTHPSYVGGLLARLAEIDIERVASLLHSMISEHPHETACAVNALYEHNPYAALTLVRMVQERDTALAAHLVLNLVSLNADAADWLGELSREEAPETLALLVCALHEECRPVGAWLICWTWANDVNGAVELLRALITHDARKALDVLNCLEEIEEGPPRAVCGWGRAVPGIWNRESFARVHKGLMEELLRQHPDSYRALTTT